MDPLVIVADAAVRTDEVDVVAGGQVVQEIGWAHDRESERPQLRGATRDWKIPGQKHVAAGSDRDRNQLRVGVGGQANQHWKLTSRVLRGIVADNVEPPGVQLLELAKPLLNIEAAWAPRTVVCSLALREHESDVATRPEPKDPKECLNLLVIDNRPVGAVELIEDRASVPQNVDQDVRVASNAQRSETGATEEDLGVAAVVEGAEVLQLGAGK